MKIISLVENTSGREDIGSEHGLSLYIEACGRKILFDMGQGELFHQNATTLGIDLSKVDIAVISHGHYDHGGGLAHFTKINGTAPVYIREKSFLPYFNGEKYIGLDPAIENCDRLRVTSGDVELASGLRLSAIDVEPADRGRLTVRRDEKFIPDSFDHEQYLLIEENGKRVLVSGCSHKGILAIAERFRPDVLVGGFHFMDSPLDDRMIAAAERLNTLGCDCYTCHCTGLMQYDFLTKYMNRIKYLSAGDGIEI